MPLTWCRMAYSWIWNAFRSLTQKRVSWWRCAPRQLISSMYRSTPQRFLAKAIYKTIVEDSTISQVKNGLAKFGNYEVLVDLNYTPQTTMSGSREGKRSSTIQRTGSCSMWSKKWNPRRSSYPQTTSSCWHAITLTTKPSSRGCPMRIWGCIDEEVKANLQHIPGDTGVHLDN